ncbi:MAG: group III truncated hemoglobin [Rhodanobacter sp.]
MNQATPFDESALATLVDHFYEKVRADAAIGPIFHAAVHDWDEHKRLLTSFWCSVALGAASYRGNPMAVHRAQPDIRLEHFERWLQLWRETCAEELDATHAERMLEYAQRIGRSLKYGMGLNPQAQSFGVPIISTGTDRS